MKPKKFTVFSEGDLEDVLKAFLALAKTRSKRKIIHIQVPTKGLSEILLKSIQREFETKELGDPSNFHVHVYIERKVNE